MKRFGYVSTAAALAIATAVSLPFTRATAQSTPAGSAKVELPGTLAGRTVAEWLDAWNSGDSVKLGEYYKKWHLQRSLAAQMERRRMTGAFDVVSIERSEPRLLEFVVKERNTPNTAFTIIEIAPGDTTLTQSFLSRIPPGKSAADFRIDAATRKRVIEEGIAQLDSSYVFPDVAARMAAAVRAHLKRGDYDRITNGVTFAERVTDDLREVSHDLHLGVDFAPAGVPDERQGGPSPEDVGRFRRQMETLNCGFVKAEILGGGFVPMGGAPQNVGYLKFNFFADTALCAPTASAAMNFIANTDALIIDLRQNGGGQPGMVAYVSSYLFDARTHLNDLWTRRTNHTEEFWTGDVPGKRFGGTKPVYVLTSRNTFSGAEEFTYNLKNLKRATIIGETTGGGAHPVRGHKIDARFMIGVPFARAINPISKSNWEGTGVEPDVKVSADDALATAQRLIAERVRP